jgi:hypothetical protein
MFYIFDLRKTIKARSLYTQSSVLLHTLRDACLLTTPVVRSRVGSFAGFAKGLEAYARPE